VDIEKEYDMILRFCYMKTMNLQVAEDLTQETFLRFFENDSYKDMGKKMAYLYTIARNLCMDHFRKKEFLDLDENVAGKDYINRAHNRMAIEEALYKLPEEEREILFLRYVNEVPINQIAKSLNISRFSLHRKIKKALDHLKEVYDE